LIGELLSADLQDVDSNIKFLFSDWLSCLLY